MMKMATIEGCPLRQGAGTGLDWFLVATEASSGGTPDLFSILEVLGYMELYRQKKHVRGATGAPRGRGHALGGGRAPHPREHLVPSLTWGPSPSGVFPSKNNFSSRFRSVSTPSDIPFLQNTEIGIKQQIWAGPPVNRLVPKMI